MIGQLHIPYHRLGGALSEPVRVPLACSRERWAPVISEEEP